MRNGFVGPHVRIATGVEGLDEMLGGGLLPARPYLLVGPPGSGKTTMAMQFLLKGIRQGEEVLYVTLDEPPNELRSNFRSFPKDIDKVWVFDAIPDVMRYEKAPFKDIATVRSSQRLGDVKSTPRQTDEFRSVEIAITALMQALKMETVKRLYRRIVVDSLTALKYFGMKGFDDVVGAQAFLRFLSDLKITTIVTVEEAPQETNPPERLLARGEIRLRSWDAGGTQVRVIGIEKFRGSAHDQFLHPYRITSHGIEIDRSVSIPLGTTEFISTPIEVPGVLRKPSETELQIEAEWAMLTLLDDVRELSELGIDAEPVRGLLQRAHGELTAMHVEESLKILLESRQMVNHLILAHQVSQEFREKGGRLPSLKRTMEQGEPTPLSKFSGEGRSDMQAMLPLLSRMVAMLGTRQGRSVTENLSPKLLERVAQTMLTGAMQPKPAQAPASPPSPGPTSSGTTPVPSVPSKSVGPPLTRPSVGPGIPPSSAPPAVKPGTLSPPLSKPPVRPPGIAPPSPAGPPPSRPTPTGQRPPGIPPPPPLTAPPSRPVSGMPPGSSTTKTPPGPPAGTPVRTPSPIGPPPRIGPPPPIGKPLPPLGIPARPPNRPNPETVTPATSPPPPHPTSPREGKDGEKGLPTRSADEGLHLPTPSTSPPKVDKAPVPPAPVAEPKTEPIPSVPAPTLEAIPSQTDRERPRPGPEKPFVAFEPVTPAPPLVVEAKPPPPVPTPEVHVVKEVPMATADVSRPAEGEPLSPPTLPVEPPLTEPKAPSEPLPASPTPRQEGEVISNLSVPETTVPEVEVAPEATLVAPKEIEPTPAEPSQPPVDTQTEAAPTLSGPSKVEAPLSTSAGEPGPTPPAPPVPAAGPAEPSQPPVTAQTETAPTSSGPSKVEIPLSTSAGEPGPTPTAPPVPTTGPAEPRAPPQGVSSVPLDSAPLSSAPAPAAKPRTRRKSPSPAGASPTGAKPRTPRVRKASAEAGVVPSPMSPSEVLATGAYSPLASEPAGSSPKRAHRTTKSKAATGEKPRVAHPRKRKGVPTGEDAATSGPSTGSPQEGSAPEAGKADPPEGNAATTPEASGSDGTPPAPVEAPPTPPKEASKGEAEKPTADPEVSHGS